MSGLKRVTWFQCLALLPELVRATAAYVIYNSVMKTRLFPNLRDKQLRNIIYVALPSQINSTRAKKGDIHQGNTSTLIYSMKV